MKRHFTDGHEGYRHFMVKCAIYKYLVDLGRDVDIEFDMGNAGIADIFDRSEGLVYEIQGLMNKRILDKKIYGLYLKNVLVKDVKIIPLYKFSLDNIKNWNNIIEQFVI